MQQINTIKIGDFSQTAATENQRATTTAAAVGST